MPGTCEHRLCHPDPPKKALGHKCLLGGVDIKYRRSISVLSEQYETSYIFYVTLSFLCNIICYLISVFAFSFPGSQHTGDEELERKKGLSNKKSG